MKKVGKMEMKGFMRKKMKKEMQAQLSLRGHKMWESSGEL